MANEYKVTFYAVEILRAGGQLARTTWFGTEVLRTTDTLSFPRVTWFGVEVLRDPAAPSFPRVTWYGVEVLRDPLVPNYAYLLLPGLG